MKQVIDESRRQLLKRVSLGAALIPFAGLPLRAAIAADLPLVTADDPTAKALQYVSDASKASGAKPGQQVRQLLELPGCRWVRPGWLPIVPRQSGNVRRLVCLLDRQGQIDPRLTVGGS